MTEDEAKTKWCPFARVVPGKLSQADMVLDGAPHAHNRVQEVGAADATWHAAMNCIGAACMAWCLKLDAKDRASAAKRGDDVATDGYCGLAGAQP